MQTQESKNLKLIVSWNGEKFSGYQIQPNTFTVQEALTNAWKTLTKEDVVLNGCSRLDAGVHAQHYVLNFLTKTSFDPMRIVKSLNGILHAEMAVDIAIYSAAFVPLNFHSRFNAIGKHYRYLIWYGHAQHAFLTKRSWHVKSKVVPKDLKNILNQFLGEHDFSAFRSSDCSAKNTHRNIINIDAWHHPLYSEMIIVDFWGESFLKNMIRNIVGTTIEIATEKLDINTIQEAFIHKSRSKTGMCAPAWGLSLMDVYYDKHLMKERAADGARHLLPC